VETYNAHELLFRIREALALYKNRPAWRKLISVAMAKDFTWQASAREYIRFYQE
jgi:starch synthase